MHDTVLLEKVTQFTREKIPARNVHALGEGCKGHFIVTKDITKYTCAKVFSKVGKKTDLICRMSGTFTEQGDPDTTRDLRGFACKLYTEEGNWDLMTINTPVFLNRDMKSGPDGVHAMKRDPRNGLWNPTQTWDFAATHPESLHFFTMLFTDDVGTPLSFRHMHGYGCNTYSFINANKERFWVKFHLVSQQERKGFTCAEAKMMMGEDPNWLSRDLIESITKGNYPKWKLCVQIMTEDEGYTFPYTFDATKVWPHQQFPLIEVGILELNKNVTDYFTEVEQVAFSPANIVPGIGFSPDKLLQGRLLVYDDAQHHRIGPNHKELHVNKPHKVVANTMWSSGGNMQLDMRDKFPHYYPNSFSPMRVDHSYMEPPLKVFGPVGYYDFSYDGTEADYYTQPREFFRLLDDTAKQHLIHNMADSLKKVTVPAVVTKVLTHLNNIDPKLGKGVGDMLRVRMEGGVKKTESEFLAEDMRRRLNLESSY
jgi:catalase